MKRTWIPLTPYVPVETTKGWGYAWYILGAHGAVLDLLEQGSARLPEHHDGTL